MRRRSCSTRRARSVNCWTKIRGRTIEHARLSGPGWKLREILSLAGSRAGARRCAPSPRESISSPVLPSRARAPIATPGSTSQMVLSRLLLLKCKGRTTLLAARGHWSTLPGTVTGAHCRTSNFRGFTAAASRLRSEEVPASVDRRALGCCARHPRDNGLQETGCFRRSTSSTCGRRLELGPNPFA